MSLFYVERLCASDPLAGGGHFVNIEALRKDRVQRKFNAQRSMFNQQSTNLKLF